MTLELLAEIIFDMRDRNVFNRINHVGILCYSYIKGNHNGISKKITSN